METLTIRCRECATFVDPRMPCYFCGEVHPEAPRSAESVHTELARLRAALSQIAGGSCLDHAQRVARTALGVAA